MPGQSINSVEGIFAYWKNSLYPKIDLAGLHSRNPTAHKWKAPFRSLFLREAVFWRFQDLLSQSYTLHREGHALGARILLRSGLETLATLIYLNQMTASVLAGDLDFHTFSDKTSLLLLGSRNETTNLTSMNIITVLEKCDKRYKGLKKLYDEFSESSHPNYEGICLGYSTIDRDNDMVIFSNRWVELYNDKYLENLLLFMQTFEKEYNDVWSHQMEELEAWIEKNDSMLETTNVKHSPL